MLRRLGLLLLLAGCTAPVPPAAAPAAASRATIVAVRGVAPAPDVLTVLGAPAAVPGTAREIILRTEDGRIISIVQEGEAAWQPGQPVSLIPGAQARLVVAD